MEGTAGMGIVLAVEIGEGVVRERGWREGVDGVIPFRKGQGCALEFWYGIFPIMDIFAT